MHGDYSPTPVAPQVGLAIEAEDGQAEMVVTAQQMATDPSRTTTEDMMAAMGAVPGFSNEASITAEGDVGGARPQS